MKHPAIKVSVTVYWKTEEDMSVAPSLSLYLPNPECLGEATEALLRAAKKTDLSWLDLGKLSPMTIEEARARDKKEEEDNET